MKIYMEPEFVLSDASDNTRQGKLISAVLDGELLLIYLSKAGVKFYANMLIKRSYCDSFKKEATRHEMKSVK